MFPLIDKALATATAFATYMLPGEDKLRWIIDLPGRTAISSRQFTIQPWLCAEPGVTLRDTIAPEEFAKADLPAGFIAPPSLEDISKADYINSLQAIIQRLTKEGGKVVISRTESVYIPGFSDVPHAYSSLAQRIFEAYPGAFRYVCYTPQFGAWMGATPEVLFDLDSSSGQISTMALAGTLRRDDPAEWDEKNLHEHRVVADYILDTLRNTGIDAIAAETRTLNVGEIRHLLTPITAQASGKGAAEIAHLLHPTPAICGYPKQRALEIIEQAERHCRECYGGYIVTDDGNRARAYVNLRCFRFGGDKFRFYAGGGILSASDPETEWLESSLKIQATRRFLSSQQ